MANAFAGEVNMAEMQLPETRANAVKDFADHQAQAAKHLRKVVFNLVPGEARAHGKAALKEGLLSLRTLIDGAVEWLERSQAAQPAAKQPANKTKVKVTYDEGP
jgi:hypothetical protein